MNTLSHYVVRIMTLNENNRIFRGQKADYKTLFTKNTDLCNENKGLFVCIILLNQHYGKLVAHLQDPR